MGTVVRLLIAYKRSKISDKIMLIAMIMAPILFKMDITYKIDNGIHVAKGHALFEWIAFVVCYTLFIFYSIIVYRDVHRK